MDRQKLAKAYNIKELAKVESKDGLVQTDDQG